MDQDDLNLIKLKTLQILFDSSPLPMGMVELVDDDVRHLYDNKLVAKFFGRDQEYVKGKFSSQLGSSSEMNGVWVQHYRKSLKTKKPVSFDYWHAKSSGKFHLTVTVNFLGTGTTGYPRFSYFVQNTTESKQFQHDLKNQEIFLETILDNIPDMIFVKDAAELRFLKFNKAGKDLLGYSHDDLIGKNDYDFFPEDQALHFTSEDRAVFEGRKMVEIQQEPIDTRFKGRRILHTKKIPLFDLAGNPQYLVGISEDVTEKIIAEENKHKMYQDQVARSEAEKSLRERDEFISIASHELKSPLSALKLQAQMFRRKIQKNDQDAFSEKKILQLIDLTEKEVQRLDRLVNDMLDVSRIRTGNLSMDMTDVNFTLLIKDIISRMREHFIQASCEIPTIIEMSEDIKSHLDSLRIEQVIVNLLTNSIRYGKGSKIIVTVSKNDSKARVTVNDHGIGIDPDKIDKIFNRFERAVERKEVSGLGLGLFISKQIIEAHNGKIWVESNDRDGTTFYVELPL